MKMQEGYTIHDDAIVITLMIVNYTTRIVLVDNGSSADILYYPAFQQMKIDEELFHPKNFPLIGFEGTKALLVGIIYLPVMVGSYRSRLARK